MDIKKDIKIGGILHDLIFASLIAFATIEAWLIVALYFGRPDKISNEMMTLLGGILTIAGLIFKQYMIKEVLEYLKAWGRMRSLLDDILQYAMTPNNEGNEFVNNLLSQKDQVAFYAKYVQRELFIIPLVPLALIFLYGCTLVSENSMMFRLFCLYGMIVGVTYLAIAAVTSGRIASGYPDLEDTICELEKLCEELKTESRKN